ncbi:MAG: hypothetical protein WCF85_10465 [Rhodospirillaceae bacterium]
MTGLEITRSDTFVTVTDGDDIRVRDCHCPTAAQTFADALQDNLEAAWAWLHHREPIHVTLPLVPKPKN